MISAVRDVRELLEVEFANEDALFSKMGKSGNEISARWRRPPP